MGGGGGGGGELLYGARVWGELLWSKGMGVG